MYINPEFELIWLTVVLNLRVNRYAWGLIFMLRLIYGCRWDFIVQLSKIPYWLNLSPMCLMFNIVMHWELASWGSWHIFSRHFLYWFVVMLYSHSTNHWVLHSNLCVSFWLSHSGSASHIAQIRSSIRSLGQCRLFLGCACCTRFVHGSTYGL